MRTRLLNQPQKPHRSHWVQGALSYPKSALLLVLFASTVLATGCATRGAGPPFEPAAAPAEHRGRLYLYRADGRNSLSRVRLTLGDRVIGKLAEGEYATVDVSAGSHLLRGALRSLAGVYWNRDEQHVRFHPGETVYIQVSVRLTDKPSPGGRELEIGGRPSGSAGETVYFQVRAEEEALAVIQETTRVVP